MKSLLAVESFFWCEDPRLGRLGKVKYQDGIARAFVCAEGEGGAATHSNLLRRVRAPHDRRLRGDVNYTPAGSTLERYRGCVQRDSKRHTSRREKGQRGSDRSVRLQGRPKSEEKYRLCVNRLDVRAFYLLGSKMNHHAAYPCVEQQPSRRGFDSRASRSSMCGDGTDFSKGSHTRYWGVHRHSVA